MELRKEIKRPTKDGQWNAQKAGIGETPENDAQGMPVSLPHGRHAVFGDGIEIQPARVDHLMGGR